MAEKNMPASENMIRRQLTLGHGLKKIQKKKHWSLSKDAGDIAWLVLDREDENTNTLCEDVLVELDALLEKIEATALAALVIRSAKTGGFIAGTDIRELQGMTEAVEAEARMKRAHAIIDRLAALRIPTIAVVHGHCLGGGLELALACKHRIAIEGATFGFPEISLGLHPGLGGSFRLPALIAPGEAMKMMLDGKSVDAGKARELGLVDTVVEERHVASSIEALVSRRLKPARPGSGLSRLGAVSPFRHLAVRKMRSSVARQVREKDYPAPYRLIDLWLRNGGRKSAMQAGEIRSFARLLSGATAQNLIHVFFLREHLKASGGGESGIAHVHVIGAGAMGANIAAWCASRGLRVTLSDTDEKALTAAIERAARQFGEWLHSGTEQRAAFDRLIPDFADDGLRHADLVIEAAAEKLDVKRKLLKAVSSGMKKDAVLVSSTTSLSLDTLLGVVSSPERVAGLHFFNPVSQVELVEVVSHSRVSRTVKERLTAFCGSIDRLPAPVRSSPGFLVNRALSAYLGEAFVMLEEGVRKESLDEAAEDFGMAVGPVELADRIGLDICLEVARALNPKRGKAQQTGPKWLETLVAEGRTGIKTGSGLYEYDKSGRPKKKSNRLTPHPMITDRLILPMLNSCAACLREGVVADEETLEAAMVFAAGFAPFRGGPLTYARRRGCAEIVSTLERLQEKYGERFTPDPYWLKIAASPRAMS